MGASLRRIKIAYKDFPGTLDRSTFFLTRLLEPHYEIEFSDDPDFTVFSCWGRRHLLDSGVKIFFSSENFAWDFSMCDFAITSDLVDDPRHHRFPVYARFLGDPSRLIKTGIDPEAVLREKTGFCNFLYSNAAPTMRDEFFRKLSRYKKVDSGGGHLNNLGYRVQDKKEFIGRYKFTIAFENGSHPGYTTEKLTDPMFVNSLPLYWGNPMVERDFNPASFLHMRDETLDEFVERIIEVDRDPELYARYMSEPWFHDNEVSEYLDSDRMLAWLHSIFDRDPVLVPPSRRARLTYATWWVGRPAFDAVHRSIQRRPRLYRFVRSLWRAIGLRNLWEWISARSRRWRPETPGAKPPRAHRSTGES